MDLKLEKSTPAPLDASPKSVQMTPQETRQQRSSPYPQSSLTPHHLRFSPVPTISHVYFTTPRLKIEVPGSIECTPDLLKKFVSPPPGFEGSDKSSPEEQFAGTTRRLEYLEQIEEEPERLIRAVKKQVAEQSGMTLDSSIRTLLASFSTHSPDSASRNVSSLCTAEVQTDLSPDAVLTSLSTELEASKADIQGLQTHIKTASVIHATELKTMHTDYRDKIQKMTASFSVIETELKSQKLALETQIQNLRNILSLNGLVEPVTSADCTRCVELRDRIDMLQDQIQLLQDYIRKTASSTSTEPTLMERKGKALRSDVHKQVVKVEELILENSPNLPLVRDEFLKLPYLLKPLFDLVRGYERISPNQGKGELTQAQVEKGRGGFLHQLDQNVHHLNH